jgi:hypothetical protein
MVHRKNPHIVLKNLKIKCANLSSEEKRYFKKTKVWELI